MKVPFLNLAEITALNGAEIEAAARRVIKSGRYLQGEEVARFEAEYADFIGAPFCVSCGNGLDALYLIFRALIERQKLQAGDEVLVPANTFIATILAISENNLTPVLIEPNPETLEIDDTKIEEKITEKTRALMIVHLYGRNAMTAKIAALCQKYDLILLEDNAQAQGCAFENQKTGALGLAAAHSFYPGKNLGALADAGAVTTNDSELAETLRALANYGSRQKYVFDFIGRNSRLDELNAAILRVKLRHLNAHNAWRQKIGEFYFSHIQNPQIRLPRETAAGENVFHLFPVFCERRDALQNYLKTHGIETLIHYPIPPHLQKCYAHFAGWQNLHLPITEKLHEEELSLPISPALPLAAAEYVVQKVNDFPR